MSWHYFNSSKRSVIYGDYISPFAQSIRDSWGVSSEKGLHSQAYKELQFDRAMDIIYKHQHPQDCSQVHLFMYYRVFSTNSISLSIY